MPPVHPNYGAIAADIFLNAAVKYTANRAVRALDRALGMDDEIIQPRTRRRT